MYLFHKRGDILIDIIMTGSLNPKRVFELFSYKIAYAKEHPEELRTTGIRIFCGSQGSGKTLSAVQNVRKLLVQ